MRSPQEINAIIKSEGFDIHKYETLDDLCRDLGTDSRQFYFVGRRGDGSKAIHVVGKMPLKNLTSIEILSPQIGG